MAHMIRRSQQALLSSMPATKFLVRDLNKKNKISDPEWSTHNQPKSVNITIDKLKQLPRRSKTGVEGYDALSIVIIDCVNDGSPVKLISAAPAPQPQDTYHYATMIDRLSGLYEIDFLNFESRNTSAFRFTVWHCHTTNSKAQGTKLSDLASVSGAIRRKLRLPKTSIPPWCSCQSAARMVVPETSVSEYRPLIAFVRQVR